MHIQRLSTEYRAEVLAPLRTDCGALYIDNHRAIQFDETAAVVF